MKNKLLIYPLISILLLIILCFVWFSYEYREGDYPYIFNEASARYKYHFEYIDGNGVYIIYYNDALDKNAGKTLLNDVYPDLSQSCNFIYGRYESKTDKNGYFSIDKNQNIISFDLDKNTIIKALNDQGFVYDNTRKISDRKHIYEKCR